MNTPSVVTEDLREFSRGADALAVESPRLGESIRSSIGLVVRYPLCFLGLQALFLFV